MMNRVILFVPLAIFIGLGALLYRGMGTDPSLLPSPLIDRPFPPFSLATLDDPEGAVTEAALKGEVALVNVWATWCIACRVEHPWLMKIAEEAGIPIYGVNYKDDRDEALAWLKKFRDPYRFSVYDRDGSLGLDLGVYGAPETFLIDANGVVRYKHVGVIDDRVWKTILLPRVQALLEDSQSRGRG